MISVKNINTGDGIHYCNQSNMHIEEYIILTSQLQYIYATNSSVRDKNNPNSTVHSALVLYDQNQLQS
jgi:hypothetical protein